MNLAARILSAAALCLLLGGLTSGCTTNPATGESTFTGGFGPDDEIRVGRAQHPQIIKQFGGEYGSPALRHYVDSVGQLLARTVERRNFKYTFTLLNSKDVNAFAIPGGYIYVTRGLMALASNEAELAAVLAHELGHINALHHARRQGQGLIAQILTLGLGVAAGREAQQLGNVAAAGVLSAYSREHEREADALGLRYMTRAGYDPHALAEFLNKLRAESRVTARRLGRPPDSVDETGFLATHPATIERVQTATRLAAGYHVANPMRAGDIYLGKINGMLYGDDPEQGFSRGRVFAHPKLRFRFEVPPGFRLFNARDAVLAKGPNDAAIRFDQAPRPSDGPVTYYLSQIWAKNAGVRKVEALRINGLEAATGLVHGRVNGSARDIRLLAIRKDLQTIYRFLFISRPQDTARLALPYRRTTYSFRLIGAAEARALRPLRVTVVRVRPGDGVAAFARRMRTERDFAADLFRALNGLAPGQAPAPGSRVKIITE